MMSTERRLFQFDCGAAFGQKGSLPPNAHAAFLRQAAPQDLPFERDGKIARQHGVDVWAWREDCRVNHA